MRSAHCAHSGIEGNKRSGWIKCIVSHIDVRDHFNQHILRSVVKMMGLEIGMDDIDREDVLMVDMSLGFTFFYFCLPYDVRSVFSL